MAGLTCENLEASRTNSLCMLSPPCSLKTPSGKRHFLINGVTGSSSMCIFGGKVAFGNVVRKKFANSSVSLSVDKLKVRILE